MTLLQRLDRLPAPAKIAVVAAAATALALLLNVALRYAGIAAGLSARSPILSLQQVAFLTILGGIAGTIVFVLVRAAVKRNPARVWRIVAYAALAVSMIPDLAFAFPALRGIIPVPTFTSIFGGSGMPRPSGGSGGAPPPGAGGFGGGNLDLMIAVLVAMHLIAGILLTEALARYALAAPAPDVAAEPVAEPASP